MSMYSLHTLYIERLNKGVFDFVPFTPRATGQAMKLGKLAFFGCIHTPQLYGPLATDATSPNVA